ETVRVVIHEDPHTHLERNFEVVADESGNIAGSYQVEDHDLFVRFVVGARGLTSGFAAQTAFSDGIITVNILSPTAGSPAVVTTLPANVPVQFSYSTNGSGGIITFTINIRNGATIVGQTNGTLARSNGGTTTVTFPVNIPAGTPNGLHAVDVILSNPGGTGNPITLSDTENNAVNINAAVNTSLTLAAPSPPSVPFGSSGPVTLSATLVRQIGGAPVGGATITFRVDGAPVGTGVTNASGLATLSYNPSNLTFGGHNIQATFAGQTIAGTTYVGSSSNIQSFNVTAASTTIALHNWSELSPTGTGPSTATCAPSSVADNDGRLIVFARTGCGTGGNEVWVLNGADGLGGTPSWTLVASGGPPGRHAQTAAYDPVGNKLIVFAGCAGGCLPTLNDVWVLSNANGQGGPAVWTQLTPSGAPPATRNHAAGAYDPASNRLIIFGGQNGSGVVAGQTFADVWVLSNANGSGGTPAWTQLATSGVFPLGQYQARAFYDSNTNRFSVAGGARSDTGAASSAVNVLTNANGIGGTPTWTNLIADGAPGAPAFAGWAAAYDPSNKRGIFAEQSTSNLYVLSNPNGLGGPTAYKQLTPRNGIGLVPTTGLGIDPTTSRIMTLYQNPANESYVLEPDTVDSSSFGDPVTFTAKIDVTAPGAGSPSGSVVFRDGVTPIGGGTVTGGFASFTTSTLTPGVHNITAQFISSFPGFTGSTSAVLVHTVNKVATTTTLESSLNPSTFGENVTFTSTTEAAGTPVDEGSVTFIEGGTCAAPGTILAGPTPVGTTGPTTGQASFSTSALTAGGHTITACYTATNHADSEGNVLQTVNKRDTLTTVSSSLNPSTFGESVTFTATVVGTGAGAGDPSGGSVQFKIDGANFGAPVALVAGSASSGAISSLTAGNHTVEAFFTSADTNFNDSGDELTQTVNKRNTLTTVSSSLNPSTYGQAVTFTATVAGTGAGAGNPSGGTVQFKIDGVNFGAPVTLSAGGATSNSINSLNAGNHTVEAVFNSSDTNFNNSNDLLDGGQTVNKASLTITASSHTVTFNDPVPTITPSYTGFVVGDDPTDLTIQPTCSTTYTVGSLVGTYPTKCENAVSGNYNFTYVNGTVTVVTACSAFNGFLSPIGGAVEVGNGGTFASPVRSFKLNSTIPVKFNAVCFGVPLTTGIHTMQAIKYSNSTTFDDPIDATPTDSATTGNQFRLTGTEWHFNLSTKGLGNNGQGTWLLRATLFDGSSYTVWVSLKK
ncbi:MAG TPA: Ig-like domain repeat protein, partial [Pyrinomonadaceae bacterium]|nr:Ig-like domain repeat protein [Pyrinomonadaceae bacterium]